MISLHKSTSQLTPCAYCVIFAQEGALYGEWRFASSILNFERIV